MSDEWDADKVAAECAATAREKTRATRRRPKRGESPAIPIVAEADEDDPPMRDGEGRFASGHGGVPGSGRPKGADDFKPEYVERVRKWASMGATNAEMASWLECALSTFHRWRHEHPDFAEAVKTGKAPADDRVQRSLFERASGYTYTEEVAIKVKVAKDVERVEVVTVEKHMPPSELAIIFWLTNRRGEEWKHKRTIEHSGTIEHVSPDEARRELADFYANDGRKIIDVTPTRLPAPDAEEAGASAPASS